MFKKVLKLKDISSDLLDFLKSAVEECFKEIETGGLRFQKYLGQFDDFKKVENDIELLDFLKTRLVYVNKLRHHYWIYETGYNENVYDLVSVHFNNRTFDKLHYLTCENKDISDSSDWKEDCDCFSDFFHAVTYDVSEEVNKRYAEICELEEKYRDLHSEIKEKLEELED